MITFSEYHLASLLKVALLLSLAVLPASAGTEAEKLLSSSHVAVVVVRGVGERSAQWEPVDVSIAENLKGDWQLAARIFVRVAAGSDGLKKGGRYLVFCSEANLPERGASICTREEEIVLVDGDATALAVGRISRTAAQQRHALKKALQATMLKPPLSGEVPNLLTLLFEAETQRDAVRRLLALPEEANKALAMHVYDTRPIPKNLLSPDEPITFHASPVAECQSVQDVVVWVLGLRLRQSFGYLSEAPSLAGRTTIADAWFYWVMAEK